MEVVNGYPCKTCTDVEYAKKNIDPAHPKDGPNGVDAKDRADPRAGDPVIQFGGAVQPPQLNGASASDQGVPRRDQGVLLDVKV